MVQIIKVRESYGFDWHVYVGQKLIRVRSSKGVANSVAAAYA